MNTVPVVEEIEKLVAAAYRGALSDGERSALRTALRVTLEFGAYLANGCSGGQVELGQFRSEIRASIEQFLSSLGVGGNLAEMLSEGVRLSADDYVNETTLSALESFERTEEISQILAGKRREPQMEGWPVYSGVSELGAEYARHLGVLASTQLELEVRLRALLNLMRLQLVFLANTAL